jgi:hypothetical protein
VKRGGLIGDSGLALDHDGYEGDQGSLRGTFRSCRPGPGGPEQGIQLVPPCRHPRRAARLGSPGAWKSGLAVVGKRPRSGSPGRSPPTSGSSSRASLRDEAPSVYWPGASSGFPKPPAAMALRPRPHAGRALRGRHPAIQASRGRRPDGEIDRTMAYDLRLFDLFAYDPRDVPLQARTLRGGRRYFALAAAQDPEKLEYRVKRALCERLEREVKPRARVGLSSEFFRKTAGACRRMRCSAIHCASRRIRGLVRASWPRARATPRRQASPPPPSLASRLPRAPAAWAER